MQGTSADPRSNGKWLWAAVAVGKGTELFTHENGKKLFTFRFLPKRADAKDDKPRGFHEIKDTIEKCINKGSFLVYDKWPSTVKAVRSLGYQHAPPINHSKEFRDRGTCFHPNAMESENNRFKHWSRVRYGRLQLTELDMHEYAYYVNVGQSMDAVMRSLAAS